MKKMYKINGNPENFADLQVFHKLAKQFIPYAQKKMGFDRPVGINLISDPENAKNPLGKTAHYDPNKLEVTVFVDKRHVKDILRSLSHELVHHTQNCRGDLENRPTGPGYAQEDAHMRDMEREAYERGQLALRDFEDNLKNKENQKMSEVKKVKNPGPYTTGMKAGYDKDGDGVPDGADPDPNDGNVTGKEKKTQTESVCTEAEIEEGSCHKEEGQIKEEQDDGAPADRTSQTSYGPGEEPPSEEEADQQKPKKRGVTMENWTRKNKDQLLFERLVKKWTK